VVNSLIGQLIDDTHTHIHTHTHTLTVDTFAYLYATLSLSRTGTVPCSVLSTIVWGPICGPHKQTLVVEIITSVPNTVRLSLPPDPRLCSAFVCLVR
jgi:hypothetical protein